MKYRIHRIDKIVDVTFNNQGVMNFTLKFTYVVKIGLSYPEKNYFQRQQLPLVEKNSSTQKENPRSMQSKHQILDI